MANKRLSKEKQVFILQTLCEGTPINAVCRIFKVGNHTIFRLIEETGTALAHYMDRKFVNLPCERVAMDEQWSYVHTHGARMDGKFVEGSWWH